MGVRKSKSFATTGGQYECTLDEKEITEKKKTMMAFFAADIAAQRATLRPKPMDGQTTTPTGATSAAAAARYVAATTQKRGSITRYDCQKYWSLNRNYELGIYLDRHFIE
jgi:hypothetical protein